MKTLAQTTDLIVFSSHRWDSTFTRTSQMMSRFSRYRKVYYIENPIFGVSKEPIYVLRETRDDVMVIEPYIPAETSVFEQKDAFISILMKLLQDEKITKYTIWSDSPKIMPLIRGLNPQAVIYDCITDYSVTNSELEKEMFEKADLVMTGGPTLYAAKRAFHPNIHNNSDGLDYRHFYQARILDEEPEDIQSIPHPRIGFAGEINQQIDLKLIENLADLKPEWHFILAGEVVGVDFDILPKRDNIHYLTHKSFSRLPMYISSWDVTFLPYRTNEETKFLNPSLIAESLVGGCPVVTAPLEDVVTIYTDLNLLNMAEFPLDYVRLIDSSLNLENKKDWLELVDKHFQGMSWEKSCARIAELEHDIYETKTKISLQNKLREIFLHAFPNRVPRPVGWVQGINLRKLPHPRPL